MLYTRSHNIYPGRFDTSVSQDICQFRNILFDSVKGSGKELTQIVGKDFLTLDMCFLAHTLHISPNIDAIQRFACFGNKYGAG